MFARYVFSNGMPSCSGSTTNDNNMVVQKIVHWSIYIWIHLMSMFSYIINIHGDICILRMLLQIFILLPTKICFDLMILKVGDLQWSLRKCNNVYVIIIPKIDAMKVTLSSINVFFLQGIRPLNDENFFSTKIQ